MLVHLSYLLQEKNEPNIDHRRLRCLSKKEIATFHWADVSRPTIMALKAMRFGCTWNRVFTVGSSSIGKDRFVSCWKNVSAASLTCLPLGFWTIPNPSKDLFIDIHTHKVWVCYRTIYCIVYKSVCFTIIKHLTFVCRWFKHTGQFPAGLWHLGYLYNQRYPYVEVVIRINFNIKHSFIMLHIPRTPNQASMHLLLHHLLKQLQCHGPLVRRRHRCSGRAEGHHVGTHLGEKGQTPLPLTTSDLKIPYLEKPNMDVDVLKKWDMWKTYACHNMYLLVLSYIFGKRWWLSCNCTRSDTRRDVASSSIIPYRLTALQARKPDECWNSAWNGCIAS